MAVTKMIELQIGMWDNECYYILYRRTDIMQRSRGCCLQKISNNLYLSEMLDVIDAKIYNHKN